MSGQKILIIDDEHTILRLSQLFLQKRGYSVSVSLSVNEGRGKLESGDIPELIVLDLMMPGENGFDFLEWFKKQGEPIKSVPIIVNTAKNLTEDEKCMLNLSCEKIMHKGIDFTDRLVAEVENILKKD